MTCENFQQELNLLLDKGSAKALPDEMQNHLSTCSHCNGYRNSILSLHEQLSLIPRAKPSKGLMNQLLSIETTVNEIPALLSWKYDVKRALIFLSPIVLIFLSNYLPTLVGTLINLGILTAGLVFILTTILKPMFFSRY
ncbi:MAG: hypothetical protein C0417_04025 [Chlorobiaceae bacterium]|nr:hypothetical protein [Chlorobiaceae bacterium]